MSRTNEIDRPTWLDGGEKPNLDRQFTPTEVQYADHLVDDWLYGGGEELSENEKLYCQLVLRRAVVMSNLAESLDRK
jgi:hypothetical protein